MIPRHCEEAVRPTKQSQDRRLHLSLMHQVLLGRIWTSSPRLPRTPKNDDVLAMTFLSGILLIVSSLFGCSSTPTQPLVTSLVAQPVPSFYEIRKDIYHEVGPLEGLWRISKMYHVDQQSIIDANRLKDPSSIKVGQKLRIPRAGQLRSVVPLYSTRPWSYLVIHHTASEMGNALTVDRAHHHRGFMEGLGYHFLIDNGTLGKGVGQIEVGPRWIKQQDGAHCNAAGMNENGIGISLVGNFSETRVPAEQLEALVFLVNLLKDHYRIPLDHIVRHGDVPGKNTECPGLHFPWREFKSKLSRS